jgi:hypothetical protein
MSKDRGKKTEDRKSRRAEGKRAKSWEDSRSQEKKLIADSKKSE